MSVPRELLWLIDQLRSTPQPRERLRLLALGWRTLKDASPADRLYVAKELGLEGAERLVEQLSRRGGASPARLLSALREAGDADPDRIRQVVDGVLDPQRRAETVKRLADEAADRMADDGLLDAGEMVDAVEAVAAPAFPPTEPSASELSPPAEPPSRARRKATVGPVLAASLAAASRDAEEVARQIRGERGPVRAAESPPADVSPVPDEEKVRRAGEEPEPPAVEGPASAAPAPPPAERPADTPGEWSETDVGTEPARPAPPAAAEASDLSSTLESLAAEASAIRRLQMVNAAVERLQDIEGARIREIMGMFPEAWARRRALEAVFRAGLPRDFDTAVEAASSLEASSDRLWAFTTLATSRILSDDETRALIDASGSIMVRRRLEARSMHPRSA